MRSAALATAILLAGGVTGSAVADVLPPAPSVPALPPAPAPATPVQIPVKVPSVKVPPLSVRSLPARTPSAAPSVPVRASARPVSPSLPQSVAGVPVGGSPGATGGGGSSATATSADSSSRAGEGSSIARFRSSRPWISRQGPASRRQTTLNFRLSVATSVVFTVTQISPACRREGRFTVAGHRGLNKVPFRGRVDGRMLDPGTYRIAARVPGRGTVLRVTIVIVDSIAPSPSTIAAARQSNVCSADALASASLASASASASAGSFGRGSSSGGPQSGPASKQAGAGDTASGVAGESTTVRATPFSPERVAENVRNPLVVLALALACILLGVAALPKAAIPDPRLTYFVAQHRVEVAVAGAAAFAAALLALALA